MNTLMLSRMQVLCSRREYCTQDIRRKLTGGKTPCSAEEADAVIRDLKKDKYLDDARYAGAFARDKASLTGWGATRIRYALAAKGISAEDIRQALETVDAGRSSDRLRRLLQARMKTLAPATDRRRKLLRFALSRGYSYDEVSVILQEMTQENEY